MKAKRVKRIKLAKNLLVEPRANEVLAMDTATGAIFQFEGLDASVVKALLAAGKRGLTEEQLLQGLGSKSKVSRNRALKLLSKLTAARLVGGFMRPPAFRVNAKRSSLALGALSMGAGMMLFPAPAYAIDCAGPPSCGAQGGVCSKRPTEWVCDLSPPIDGLDGFSCTNPGGTCTGPTT